MGWPQIATHHFIAEKDAIRGEHVGQPDRHHIAIEDRRKTILGKQRDLFGLPGAFIEDLDRLAPRGFLIVVDLSKIQYLPLNHTAIIRHFATVFLMVLAVLAANLSANKSPQHTLQWTMRDMATWFCNAYAFWQKGGVETSIAFPDPAQARRSRVAGAPFGLDAREVDLADGEFAPRQSAALVAIERREVLERRQTGRHVRLERVGAQDPAAVVGRGTLCARRRALSAARLAQARPPP